jgi:K+-sensing histidine kinase KdpD
MSFKTFLPFFFLGVIILIAIRFGNRAGIVGTLAAALVFATFLFEPTLSPLVEDTAARDHLIWMLLIGIILSDLLGAYTIPAAKNNIKRD